MNPLRSTTSRLAAAATGAVVVAGLVSGLAAAPAGAAPAAPAGAAKQYSRAACNRALDERLFVLAIAEHRVGEARRLTADQKATQIAGIDQVQAQLTGVNRPALQAARTAAQIRSACQAIYTDNRVYAVVLPQLFVTVRVDEYGNALDRFAPLVAEKRAAGVDVTELESLLAIASAHVDTAAALVSGVTPDRFNVDPAGVRQAFDSARAELDLALGDILRGIVLYRDLPA